MPPLRVGVVFGGRSGEHEVSLASAASVIAALERGGHTSAVGMDKVTMKAVFRAHGLPMVEHEVVMRHEWLADRAGITRRIAERIAVPCFVKPSNLGSSVGISKVRKAGDLPAAIDEAARHERKILIERAAVGREVEVSVLGNNEPVASLPAEIRYGPEWYDDATKNAEGQSQLVIPAPIGAQLTRRVQELGVAAFKAIDCAGMARVDFFLEGNDRLLVTEINTIPGFTATSAYARMWEASGLDYVALVNRLIDLALERHPDGGAR